ncbi:MAG: S8 family serine peptidase [Ruminococcus sp.]|nr:S8 family serine peptidase [Ruminococcus sp.]
MKKSNLSGRLLAMAAAAAMSCTFVSVALPAYAAETPAPAAVSQSDELKDVMITLSGNAVFNSDAAIEAGAEFLDTAEADEMINSLTALQEEAEAAIREFCPELIVKHRYTLALNGFSCTVPEKFIPEIEALPFVEKVNIIEKVAVPKPNMTNAREVSGAPAFSNNTGMYGEGEVIAVIDTELDVTNDMFAPLADGIKTALTKDDIAKIASKHGFVGDVDANKAYISNKVPFAYDYTDNTPYDITNSSKYHGTHVSGIAAGNSVTTKDGTELSGIAKNAQLVFMKTYDNFDAEYDPDYNYITIDSVAAAVEDCIKLKVDVINMSFGSNEFDENSVIYAEAMNAAGNAGIVLCGSAGNDADKFSYATAGILPANVDRSTIGTPCALSTVLGVAAASNAVFERNRIVAGETEYPFCECGSKYCSEVLSDKEYEVFYAPENNLNGLTEDDVKGKVVFLRCSDGTNNEVLNEAATKLGAAGIIITAYTDDKFETYLFTTALPVAVLDYSDAYDFDQQRPKTVTFAGSTTAITKAPETITDFSSFGCTSNLELKPEITGIGEHVLSAAYDNDYSYMSGTSMASPYTAGCVALIDEYLKEKGVLPEGSGKRVMVKNLIMNTAYQYKDQESGLPVTPRQQGAGMVDLTKIENAKVLLTGDSGYAKFELKDKLSDTFSFDITLQNFSDEDVTFSKSDIILTTDSTKINESDNCEYIYGNKLLTSTDDLDDAITVKAGESLKKTITINLDKAQIDENLKTFTSGFFIDGYLTLSGAENCCDISAPILGFCGDWAEVPNFDRTGENAPAMVVNVGKGMIKTDHCISKVIEKYKDVVSEISDVADEQKNNAYFFTTYLDEKTSDEFKKSIDALSDGVTYIAPDNDSSSEYLAYCISPERNIKISGLDIYDSNGDIFIDSSENILHRDKEGFIIPDWNLHGSHEGRYKSVIQTSINYPGADEHPQTLENDIEIDITPPQMTYKFVEKDGKKLLELTAKDKNIDGIYVLGEKSGEMSEKSRNTLNAIVASCYALQYKPNSYKEDNFGTRFGAEGIYPNEPYILNMLSGDFEKKDYFNYFDVIPAEPDKNGSVSITYDVTGLNEYSIAVLDRAMNYNSIESGTVAPANMKNGKWYFSDGYQQEYFIDFLNDKECELISAIDKSTVKFSYTYTGDRLILTNKELKREESFDISWDTREKATLTGTSGNFKDTIINFNYADVMFEGYGDFYSYDDFERMLNRCLNKKYGSYPELINISPVSLNELYVYIQITDQKGDPLYLSYKFDRFGAYSIGDEYINLFEGEKIKAGVWRLTTDNFTNTISGFCQFNDDLTGTFVDQNDGSSKNFTYCYPTDTSIEIKIDDKTLNYNLSLSSARYFCLYTDDVSSELPPLYFSYLSSVKNVSDLKFYNTSELIDMATAYCKASTGETDLIVHVSMGHDNFGIFITFNKKSLESNMEELVAQYNVDITTAKAKDMNGFDIDLTKIPGEIVLGDINGDGSVNASDASAALKIYAELSTGKTDFVSASVMKNGDVNGDGAVNASDASAILAYYSFLSTGGSGGIEEFLKAEK